MTREECKDVLQALWRYKDCGYSENEIRESLDMAIRALEQQPCEDAVSRKAVAEIINRQRFGIAKISMGIIKEKIETLPSVTPTRKKGKQYDGKLPIVIEIDE